MPFLNELDVQSQLTFLTSQKAVAYRSYDKKIYGISWCFENNIWC